MNDPRKIGGECDKHPPIGGWVPGNYECRRLACGERFIGNKHAIACADCAYLPANRQKRKP